mmetsp:Transcript_84116/g.132819  ORF Transcript_84116/g.132819 Transcript_84116/m.132819 type:complete len:193 (+) Transcript_84116:60-638(+)|eukprot:CAMPEP_0169216652 /NCGR_PEP_ID=MMETSP1016-20121227/18496_1 /TAXON_ID=342587 /ORGANISM="Karlodinium micrum, Strain CCMP2283" /LENGTH=192 /DNA_ID=CAMNT_0009294541 /DNA_START=60 /DNA_END=638 /DNA_ORIENTATION=-
MTTLPPPGDLPPTALSAVSGTAPMSQLSQTAPGDLGRLLHSSSAPDLSFHSRDAPVSCVSSTEPKVVNSRAFTSQGEVSLRDVNRWAMQARRERRRQPDTPICMKSARYVQQLPRGRAAFSASLRLPDLLEVNLPMTSGAHRSDVAPWTENHFRDRRGKPAPSHLMPAFGPHNHVSQGTCFAHNRTSRSWMG